MAENGEKPAPAAEGGGEEQEAVESVKLFVGQVPKHMTEPELAAMFQQVALVDEVTVIKDKATKASRGAPGSGFLHRFRLGLGARAMPPGGN
jgi:CUG-BP- and ETR3-like factor